MVTETNDIITIELKEKGHLEQYISNDLFNTAKCIKLVGPMSDEDVVLLGKLLRSHSNICCVDMEDVRGLTSIDHNAFEGCQSLSDFILPFSISRIGDHAFDGCSSLKSLQLPETIEIVGDRAFRGCESFDKINIPQNVTYIGVGAFYGCYKLTQISVDSRNSRYEFRGGVLFDNVDKTLLRYIPTKALEDVFTTPKGVVHIGNYAFDGCKGLVTVIVSEGCTDLGERSFTRCNDLIKIELPTTMNHLSYNAFDECNALENITVNSDNMTYKSQNGVLYDKEMRSLEICPKSRKSPFFFPQTIKKISEGAFSGCKNIRSVVLPKSIEKIENNAFSDCENLTYINIPNSLQTIGDFAFGNCKQLKRIKVNRTTPPICGVSAFASVDVKNCMVFVPIDSEMSFRKDYGWDSFNNIIENFKMSIGANFTWLRSASLAIKRLFI